MRQKQVKTSLGEDELAWLEAAAQAEGRSLADEARRRIRASLWEERHVRPDIRGLLAEISGLIAMTEWSTGQRWSQHPAAGRVLLRAIAARFGRHGMRSDSTFAATDLPAERLIGSDDPDTIGVTIEALALDRIASRDRIVADGGDFVMIGGAWVEMPPVDPWTPQSHQEESDNDD